MPSAELAVCVDFGSTFTKASLVDLTAGRIVASAEHPTTIETDVTRGLLRAVDMLVPPRSYDWALTCSSAAGGLRVRRGAPGATRPGTRTWCC